MQARPPSRRLFLAAAAALAAPRLSLAGAPAVTLLEGAAFGTGWRVALPSGAGTEALRTPLAALLAGIDRQMSPWRGDSDITRFNRAGAGERPVPEAVAQVAAAALAIAADSGGHFDPSVGPLVARWGFGPIEGDERPDWRAMSAGNGHLAKTRAGLTFDLCGIAKGHALDRMAALLRERGHGDFLIDFGGDLIASGLHPEGRGWRVAVEDPRPEAKGLATRLQPGPMAVATSGPRAQGYAMDGRVWGHIMDPATGAPVEGGAASVTVLAPTALAADGWATALAAAGAGGPTLASERGIAALFLLRDGDGLRQVATGDLARYLA